MVYNYKCEFCRCQINSGVELVWAVCENCEIENIKSRIYDLECRGVMERDGVKAKDYYRRADDLKKELNRRLNRG
jgi:hypothetical protein